MNGVRQLMLCLVCVRFVVALFVAFAPSFAPNDSQAIIELLTSALR